jgi:hypothetical protein
LLTNSFETFRDLIESSGFYGLRLLAMRDERGNPQADCRVNGTDWDKGAEALRTYVATWPAAGFEMRKQYVVLQTINKDLLPPCPPPPPAYLGNTENQVRDAMGVNRP